MHELRLIEGASAANLHFYLLGYQNMDLCKQALSLHAIPVERDDLMPESIQFGRQIGIAEIDTTTDLESNYVFVVLATRNPSTVDRGQAVPLAGSAVVSVSTSKDPDCPGQLIWSAELRSCHVQPNGNGKKMNLGNPRDPRNMAWTLEHGLRGILGRVAQYQWFFYVNNTAVNVETKEHMLKSTSGGLRCELPTAEAKRSMYRAFEQIGAFVLTTRTTCSG